MFIIILTKVSVICVYILNMSINWSGVNVVQEIIMGLNAKAKEIFHFASLKEFDIV